MTCGPSPGPPKGNKNALKHGRYTAEAIVRRRPISILIQLAGSNAYWDKIETRVDLGCITGIQQSDFPSTGVRRRLCLFAWTYISTMRIPTRKADEQQLYRQGSSVHHATPPRGLFGSIGLMADHSSSVSS